MIDESLVWDFDETRIALRISADRLSDLIKYEGLPIIPALGENKYHIYVPALKEWLLARAMSGGDRWQGSANTNTAPVPSTGTLMGAGVLPSPTHQGQGSEKSSTRRRGG